MCVWHELDEAGPVVVNLACTVRRIPTDAVDRVTVFRYPAGIRDLFLLRKVQVLSQGVRRLGPEANHPHLVSTED